MTMICRYQTTLDAQSKNTIEVKRGNFILGEELGEGQFGSVYRGTDTRNCTSVAIKLLKRFEQVVNYIPLR